MGGVVVGDNVIIGANALVTKNVMQGATILGVPGRVVGV